MNKPVIRVFDIPETETGCNQVCAMIYNSVHDNSLGILLTAWHHSAEYGPVIQDEFIAMDELLCYRYLEDISLESAQIFANNFDLKLWEP